MKKFAIIILSIFFINCHNSSNQETVLKNKCFFQYYKNTIDSITFVKTYKTKQVFKNKNEFLVKSVFMQCNMRTVVYGNPEVYSKKEKKLVYLLPGLNWKPDKFEEFIDLDSLSLMYSVIFICPPSGNNSWYINSPLKKDSQYEDFFLNELMPFIDSIFSSSHNRKYITGISMGGHGAMYIFLRNNEMFDGGGSISGVLDLADSKTKDITLSPLIGSYTSNKETYLSYSAITYVEKVSGIDKNIVIDCGTADYLYPTNIKFRDHCEKLGVRYKFNSCAGNHELAYWEQIFPNHLSCLLCKSEVMEKP